MRHRKRMMKKSFLNKQRRAETYPQKMMEKGNAYIN